jgi:hypothetical protein
MSVRCVYGYSATDAVSLGIARSFRLEVHKQPQQLSSVPQLCLSFPSRQHLLSSALYVTPFHQCLFVTSCAGARQFRATPSPRVPLFVLPAIKLMKAGAPPVHRIVAACDLTCPLQVALTVWNTVAMARAGKIVDEEQRQQRRKRIKFVVNCITAACVAGAIVFAASNLERTPITSRLRVMSGSFEDDLEECRPAADELVTRYKDVLLGNNDPIYMRIHEVVTRLLDAACSEQQLARLGVPSTEYICKKAAKVQWRLAVVDQPAVQNACVTRDGTIIVFTGLLPLLADEQTGTVTQLNAAIYT